MSALYPGDGRTGRSRGLAQRHGATVALPLRHIVTGGARSW